MPDMADALCHSMVHNDWRERVCVSRGGVNWPHDEYYKIPPAEKRDARFNYDIMRLDPVEEDGMTASVLKDRARVAFRYADTDSKGSLNKREYKIAMAAVFGRRADKADVKQTFQSRDRVSYEEFERCVLKMSTANDLLVNVGVLFGLLDKDCKGYLVLDDFCRASKFVDVKVASSVYQTIFKELDHCRKGYIEFDQFSRIFAEA